MGQNDPTGAASASTRRLLEANTEYARKIGVLRRGLQDALALLRRREPHLARAVEALENAYRASLTRRPEENTDRSERAAD